MTEPTLDEALSLADELMDTPIGVMVRWKDGKASD